MSYYCILKGGFAIQITMTILMNITNSSGSNVKHFKRQQFKHELFKEQHDIFV